MCPTCTTRAVLHILLLGSCAEVTALPHTPDQTYQEDMQTHLALQVSVAGTTAKGKVQLYVSMQVHMDLLHRITLTSFSWN